VLLIRTKHRPTVAVACNTKKNVLKGGKNANDPCLANGIQWERLEERECARDPNGWLEEFCSLSYLKIPVWVIA